MKKQEATIVQTTPDGRMIKSPLGIIGSESAKKDYEKLRQLEREGKLPLPKKK